MSLLTLTAWATKKLSKGEFQIISAGTGIVHSEMNEEDEELHLYQIWIKPNIKGVKPRYEQRKFNDEKHTLVLSPNGDNGSFKIHQDMWLHRYFLQNEELNITLNSARNYWLQVVNGKLNLHEHELGKADGVAINDEILLKIKCEKKAEFLLFDLP